LAVGGHSAEVALSDLLDVLHRPVDIATQSSRPPITTFLSALSHEINAKAVAQSLHVA
jgi:hypothetical protein